MDNRYMFRKKTELVTLRLEWRKDLPLEIVPEIWGGLLAFNSPRLVPFCLLLRLIDDFH